MGDGYWNHRQPPLHPSAGASLKRPRTEFDIPQSGMHIASEMHGYQTQSDDRGGGPQQLRDTKSLGSAYDQFLQSSRLPSEDGGHFSQAGLGRTVGADLPAFQMRDPVARGPPEAFDARNGRDMGFGGPIPVDRLPRPREPLPLPPDASNTLYIEGLPSNCTKREVSHIFRPFVGYREVRLVRKEPKYRGGDALILCFVDFVDAACAATALSALQGYTMDEHDPESQRLRLQFSRSPGPKSGSGPRGRR